MLLKHLAPGVIDQVLCLTNRRTHEQVSSSPSATTAWLHARRPFNPRHCSKVGDSQIHGEFPFSNGVIARRSQSGSVDPIARYAAIGDFLPADHEKRKVRTFSWTFLRYTNSKNRVYQFQKNLVTL